MLPAASRRLRDLDLQWRPLADAWARRQLQLAVRPDADATVLALRDVLLPVSQSAKAGRARSPSTGVQRVSHTAGHAARAQRLRCRAPGRHRRNALALGKDSDAVLAGMGLARERIATLRARGIVQ